LAITMLSSSIPLRDCTQKCGGTKTFKNAFTNLATV
jgi:hypothetical protein